MKKEKLRLIRKQKGYTQQQIADFIATDVSNYSRKESGIIKIFRDEWEKIARFLDVPLEDIYQEILLNEVVSGIVTNDEIIKYIEQLEQENSALKHKLDILNGKQIAIKKILE
ncbi:helix-turn-helix transcriptional regulator [Chryseobacterium sp. MYb328]|uniref:helix-turn-helix transcriptional regulator n=1 Tax=Chryseobacterium sp. MYb328 TaxID=2745231 RepID=UPI0030A61CE1